jgi:hypothetical protein
MHDDNRARPRGDALADIFRVDAKGMRIDIRENDRGPQGKALETCGAYAEISIGVTIPPAGLLPSNLILPLFYCV